MGCFDVKPGQSLGEAQHRLHMGGGGINREAPSVLINNSTQVSLSLSACVLFCSLLKTHDNSPAYLNNLLFLPLINNLTTRTGCESTSRSKNTSVAVLINLEGDGGAAQQHMC